MRRYRILSLTLLASVSVTTVPSKYELLNTVLYACAGIVCGIPGVRYDAAQDVGGGTVRPVAARSAHGRGHYLRYRVPPATVAAGE